MSPKSDFAGSSASTSGSVEVALGDARGPAIYQLAIEHFRGIEALSWCPAPGVNLILGGGDVGKTTVLDAIALLFSPVNSGSLSDTDYFARDMAADFSIEAVVSLPAESGINYQFKPSWPWIWNGQEAIVPSADAESTVRGEPVYRLRVRGTEDLELIYEIVQPDDTTDALSVGLRRSIGLVRLGGDDRNDRDLRLVHGSALDRLLTDKGLRSRLTMQLAKREIGEELTDSAKTALAALDTAFAEQNLPSDLDLSITGGQGASVASMVGLTATRNGVRLPLASWGAGTRRLSALAIAEQNQGESPITVVDEIERGLEPYRQRAMIEKMQSRNSQVFVTTHSPFVIAAASQSSLWYVDHGGQIGPLDGKKVDRLRQADPEAFLSRLTIVAEGATEVGFVSALLERALGSALDQHGIHVCDGGGDDPTLGVLESLVAAKMRFGGFADNEGKSPTRWKTVADGIGDLLFRWATGCIEENIIAATPEDSLETLLADPGDEKTGRRLRTLADRLDITDKDFGSIKANAGARLRALMTDAALGKVPEGKVSERKEYQSHAQIWFKTESGGRELEDKVFCMGLWPTMKTGLLPFCRAVRIAVGLPGGGDVLG